jgi:hypothetical protein
MKLAAHAQVLNGALRQLQCLSNLLNRQPSGPHNDYCNGITARQARPKFLY